MRELFDLDRADSDTGLLRLRVPLDPHACKGVRERLLEHAQNAGITAPILDDFIFAVGEALANAIEHSHTEGSVEVRCYIDDEKIIAIVTDEGQGFEFSGRPTIPKAMAERGRGLSIMQGFTDIFSLRSTPGEGTAVLLGRYR